MFLHWIQHCGGIAVWRSLDIEAPDRRWATPAWQDADGRPSPPPHELAERTPAVVCTDPTEWLVAYDEPVVRFAVCVEKSPRGWKLDGTSTARVNGAIEAAGEGAYYQFDYATQEVVILAPVRVVPLSQWTPEDTE